ncbi:MAG: sulfite exporter TauE/SafE family protein [Flavobacteriaceae bacterium]
MPFWLGFLLGLSGSLHCVGMCGPIAYLLPIKKGEGENWQRIQYHLGRVFTYTLLGILLGTIGWYINLSFFHQGLSVIVGAFLILWSLRPFFPFLKKTNRGIFYYFENSIRSALIRMLKTQTGYRMFLIGMLNGLLPCGLVYVAISGSIYYANLIAAGLFMIGFGLGTIPLLYLVQRFPKKSIKIKRWNVQTLLSLLGLLIGILILLRGLGLGVPFLSPPTQKLKLREKTNLEHNLQERKDRVLKNSFDYFFWLKK